jgi:hypothetical protein
VCALHTLTALGIGLSAGALFVSATAALIGHDSAPLGTVERLLVPRIAGSGVLTGTLEAAFPLRRILLLKGFVVSSGSLLLATDRRHTGLLVIQTFNDTLGVFVLLVLRHNSHVSAPVGDAAAAFLGPNERTPSSHHI